MKPGNGMRDPGSRARGGDPIRILVSSCLLGARVRYDGGHKRDAFLVETLGNFVEYVPVCPESECGLSTPRESMRLVGDPSSPRLVTARTGVDHTERVLRWTRRKLKELDRLDLCGYICKKDSPSSGMERVKVYGESRIPERSGAGIFTRAFMERLPLIPVEEEGRLHDPARREMFIERVFTLRRFRAVVKAGKTRGGLIAFHTDHELLLACHGRPLDTAMGKLVARAKELPADELYARYQELLMEALARRPTVARRSGVLTHMVAHFRKVLATDEKQEILDAIAQYRARLIPLIVPLTLIRHYVRKYDVPYLRRQVFLDPHPAELMLRNHA